MKIIHIVENLDKGAVENWLVNVFLESKAIRPDWEWTFYCILGKEGQLDEKIRNAGGKIIYSPVTVSNKISFLRHLRSVLKATRYDILHAHHDYLSGFYLIATIGIKFKKRLLHVHNTDKSLPVGNRKLHNLLLEPFRRIGLALTDVVIGISKNTLEEFACKSNVPNDKFIILYYGVDFNRFEIQPDRSAIRREFNLPEHSRILLYAGRMNQLKNPAFVVDVLAELVKNRDDVYAVFIGQGDEQTALRQKAEHLGLAGRVRISGWHNNVPAVMKGSDVFVFPRKEYPQEGLGLVVVEAQAAGLPLFITRGIGDDAIVIGELAHYNDLSNPAEWANQILSVLDNPQAISRSESLKIMRQSHFELGNAARNLIQLYEN